MTRTDIGTPATGGSIFDEPPAPGPVIDELVNLQRLAGLCRRHRAVSVGRDEWTNDGALRRVVDDLLDAVDVPVYVCDLELPRALCAERPRTPADQFGPEQVYPSERQRRLWDVMPHLLCKGATQGYAADLWLRREDVASLLHLPRFYLELESAESDCINESGTPPLASMAAPPAEVSATHERGDTASMRRAVGLVREKEAGRKRVPRVRKDVAAHFGINVRTLSKWIAKVEEADAEEVKRIGWFGGVSPNKGTVR